MTGARHLLAATYAMMWIASPGLSAPLLDGFGGPRGLGEQTRPGRSFEIVDVAPSGLRLYLDDPATSLTIARTGVVDLGGPQCCYVGEPLPRPVSPDLAPSARIHIFEGKDGAFEIDGDDFPTYVHREPAGADDPGRLIITWHRLPDRPDGIDGQRLNSFQLLLTTIGAGGDFDVEWRFARCGWWRDEFFPERLPILGFDSGLGLDGPAWMWPGSLTDDTQHLCELSNVREPGVFRFQVRDGLPQGCGIDAEPPPGPDRCADGNHLPGDGCSPACYVEPDVDNDGRYEAPHADSVDPLGVYDDCTDAVPECDDDTDGDGVADINDNCPEIPNADQRNVDGFFGGDVCDPDDDNDGLPDPEHVNPGDPLARLDNCPSIFNPGRREIDPDEFVFAQQLDQDRDGDGDACDRDDDNDGVLDCGDDAICDPGDNGYDDDTDNRVDEAGECLGARPVGEMQPPDLRADCLDAASDLFDNDGDDYIDEASEGGDPWQPWLGPDPNGSEDNCRRIPNPDQLDLDGDDIGDRCDPDIDGDGIPNCTALGICGPLTDGRDNNGNGIIDEIGECVDAPCDPDSDLLDQDLDGFTDEGFEVPADGWPPIQLDVCPHLYNPDQIDSNRDGIGDLCADDDGDSVLGVDDNCPGVPNADQRDLDGDGAGDACDPDDDDDGIADEVDVCPRLADPEQLDTDGDGDGDACDGDDDGDGRPDTMDVCPLVSDPMQLDLDRDGRGDACDEDDDGDRVADGIDLCPRIADDQADLDGDEIGDACDEDDDDDGFPDDADLCPRHPQPPSPPGQARAQPDLDGDGIGDACDPSDDRPFDVRSPAERCAILLERGATTSERLAHCPEPSRAVSSCRVSRPGAPAGDGALAIIGLCLVLAARRRRR